MRLSHKYKFVSLSNPQSGSTTIRNILRPYSDIDSKKDSEFRHHLNARELKKIFQKKGWNFDSYFKFTTVRNPWDKAVSRYHYGLKNPKSIWHHIAISSETFKDFLMNPETILRSKKSALAHFAYDDNGKCLIDKIIKLEKIDEEFPPIAKRIGIEAPSLPKMNSTPRSHYSSFYDAESISIIRDIFTLDITVGDYEFERV